MTVAWLRHRAQSALAACRHELRLRGEKLSTQELIPLDTTNQPNGAAVILNIRSRLGRLNAEAQPSLMRGLSPGRARVAWKQAVLPSANSTNVWSGLRGFYETNRETLSELCVALEECSAIQFHVLYSFDALIPHLAPLKITAQSLAAATGWELHDNRPQEAWRSLQALTSLATKYEGESFIISQLVRAAIVNIALAATWEALQYEGWTEPQLNELQVMWSSLHCLEASEGAIAMERAMGEPVFDRCRQDPSLLTSFLQGGMPSGSVMSDLRDMADEVFKDPKEGLRNVGATVAWSAWASYEDETWRLQAFQFELDGLRRAIRARNMHTYFTNTDPVRGEPPRTYLVSRLLSSRFVVNYVKRMVQAETAGRMTETAIAIRRYQLRHDRLPSNISALVPDFMPAVPRDPMDGQPLRYRHLDAGDFLLYSVGLDGKDDGGDPRPPDENQARKSFSWQNGRDWVWPQPASPAEVEADNTRLESERTKSGRRP